MKFFGWRFWLVLFFFVLVSFSFWLVLKGGFFKKDDDLAGIPNFSFIDKTGEIESFVLNEELLVENLVKFPPLIFWKEFGGGKNLVYEIDFDESIIDFGLKEGNEWLVGYGWSQEEGGKRMKVFLKPSLVLGEQKDFGRVENYLHWVILDSLVRTPGVFNQEEYLEYSRIIPEIMSSVKIPLEVRW